MISRIILMISNKDDQLFHLSQNGVVSHKTAGNCKFLDYLIYGCIKWFELNVLI